MPVVGVAPGLIGTANLGAETLGDGKTGSVVLGAVDAQAEDRRCSDVASAVCEPVRLRCAFSEATFGVDNCRHGAFSFTPGETPGPVEFSGGSSGAPGRGRNIHRFRILYRTGVGKTLAVLKGEIAEEKNQVWLEDYCCMSLIIINILK